MNETDLRLYYPEQLSLYSDVEEGKRQETSSEVMSELEMRLSTFLSDNFGKSKDGNAREEFRIEHLLILSNQKKEKFEHLILEMIGHYACWEYFSE